MFFPKFPEFFLLEYLFIRILKPKFLYKPNLALVSLWQEGRDLVALSVKIFSRNKPWYCNTVDYLFSWYCITVDYLVVVKRLENLCLIISLIFLVVKRLEKPASFAV